MFNFQMNIVGDFVVWIADCQSFAAHRCAVLRIDTRCSDVNRWLVNLHFGRLQPLKLLGFASGLRGGCSVGPIFVDKFLQLLLFGDHRRVDATIMLSALIAVFQKGINLSGIHR